MEYIKHLKRDPQLKKLLQQHEPLELKVSKNIIHKLVHAIIAQQLSTRVATVINNRFLDLFENRDPSLESILATPYQTYRSIGLSHAKATYVNAVAEFALANKMTDKKLLKLSDVEAMEILTQIKGVGPWTAQMLLMFHMGRPDIFSPGDLGIQIAMRKLYSLEELPVKELVREMEAIAEQWSPYRSYACLHLWRWKDTK